MIGGTRAELDTMPWWDFQAEARVALRLKQAADQRDAQTLRLQLAMLRRR